jgi:hypothetical protein
MAPPMASGLLYVIIRLVIVREGGRSSNHER